eukprot:TRINITY_DN39875_c0_g1_i1.p1 TRINITY_DN39875_c0_g1~~TRINITY_DN39875_c0_g1_i1.p1  ORF type:complete len:1562 (+),score=396.94 TRINITY_DN39875_c0_g1_i1:71-4756(+)
MLAASLGTQSVNVDVLSESQDGEGWMELEVTAKDFGAGDMLLHWGVGKQNADEWVVPVETQAKTSPEAIRVPGALQTPFPVADADGRRKIKVEINSDANLKGFQFVLHRKPNDWMKNGARNFVVDFAAVERSKGFRDLVAKASQQPDSKVSCWSSSGVDVAVIAASKDDGCDVQAVVNTDRDLVLQYGPSGADQRWLSSTRVHLDQVNGSVCKGDIKLSKEDMNNKYLMFVLHEPSVNQWLKDAGRDFAFELPAPLPGQAPAKAPQQATPDAKAFAPKPRIERQKSKKFSTFVDEIMETEPEARHDAWSVPGTDIEGVVLSSATETECSVHFLVSASKDLVVQYGPAASDRAWKSSKRVPLARAGTNKYEACFSIPAAEVDQYLMFVLHDGASNSWYKNGNSDFEFELPRHEEWDRLQREEEERKSAEAKLVMQARDSFLANRHERQAKANISFSSFELERDCGSLDVACFSTDGGKTAKAELRAWLHPRLGECLLHFGVFAGPRSGQWTSALEQKSVQWPAGIVKADEKACQVKLEKMDDHSQGFDFTMTAHTETEGSETIIEPDIGGIGFVLKTAKGDEWFKPQGGGDGSARFSMKGKWKGEWAQIADQIVEAETTWSQMSLKRRYEVCLEFVDTWEKGQGAHMRRLASWNTLVHVDSSKAVWSRMPSMPLIDMSSEEESKEEFWSWIFVWQRFSFQQLLTWERNTCTQPRMLAATTNQITARMAELWKATPSCRMWIRWTLATMGRGGSAGQQIRDEILVIMHGHGIKEIHGTYYEQWHQKLHNNTTPADIGICRAIIAYLKSGGDMGTYWRVLDEHGITKEHLTSYSRPITTEPYMVATDVNRLIGDFERYLGILRSVHDALDLQLAVDHAKGCLPGHAQQKLQDICNMGGTGFGNLDEGHGKFMKVAAAREDMLAILNSKAVEPNTIKELLVIDYSLEAQQSVLVQGLTSEQRLPQLCDQLKALLKALIGHLPEQDELQALLADWTALAPECANKSWNGATESALLLKAMSDRVSRVVGELSDHYQRLMGPKATFLGEAIDAPKKNIDVFVDEILRGSALMAVSLVLQRLEPVLRDIAHLPPWQMISPVEKPVQGEFHLIDKMMGVQGKVFETPTVLLSGAVSGEEEVPDGVVGVLVRSAKEAPDILSHCAVRARNFGVLLATCFDPKISQQLAADFEGKWVEVRCKADGTLTVVEAERPSASAAEVKAEEKTAQTEVRMNLTDDLKCSWCVRPDEMTKQNVGSKSLNLALLKPKLPSDILTPQAVALPYGSMQKSLTDTSNKDTVLPVLEKVLGRLQPHTPNEEAQSIFEEAQQIVESMKFPTALKDSLREAMGEVGKQDGEERIRRIFRERDAWQAIKGVWSSLFALRPWVSLAKAGRSFHELNMAVLVQEVVEAKYAFVLHTINPFTKDKDELYGELVAGRGETLVGNYPGRALSFAMKRGEEPRVISFPSKSCALHTQECLIFRSDSNGEDLEGFAGAGLFESVCAEEDKGGFQRLHRLQVVTDRSYRLQLLKRIAEVGWAVEKAFDGAPQDIEGCVDVQERIFIVQSRPQV